MRNSTYDTFVTLGASNHTKSVRQADDYYATEPKAVECLLGKETFSNPVWECACGGGHISEVLKKHGYEVASTDLYDRGYGDVADFFSYKENSMDIVTNPPYKNALPFVQHALKISHEGVKIAMFLRLQFLEGKARRKFFEEYPPKIVYVASGRLHCAKNGDFKQYHASAMAYTWFIWVKGYQGKTVVDWIN